MPSHVGRRERNHNAYTPKMPAREEISWWKAPRGRGTQYARWLRFFRRQVHLQERTAHHLTVPEVNLFAPRQLSLPEGGLLSTPQRLDCAASLASATNLTVDLVPSAQAENGSVTLAGVLLNTEPTPRLTFPPPSKKIRNLPTGHSCQRLHRSRCGNGSPI